MEQDTTLTVRLPHSYRARLKAIQAEMSKKLSGVDLRWSQVIRLALERGAETIEKELGLK
jgi:hypothetical protein